MRGPARAAGFYADHAGQLRAASGPGYREAMPDAGDPIGSRAELVGYAIDHKLLED